MTGGCPSTDGRNGSRGTYSPPDAPPNLVSKAAFTAVWISGTERKLTVKFTASAPWATSCRCTSR